MNDENLRPSSSIGSTLNLDPCLTLHPVEGLKLFRQAENEPASSRHPRKSILFAGKQSRCMIIVEEVSEARNSKTRIRTPTRASLFSIHERNRHRIKCFVVGGCVAFLNAHIDEEEEEEEEKTNYLARERMKREKLE